MRTSWYSIIWRIPAKWEHTLDADGQWQLISDSFVRYPREVWPVERYVRIGYDTFILQSRTPSFPCDRPSEDGTYYDVPLKLLKVLSSSRSFNVDPIPPGPRRYLHHGPGSASVEYYWQVAYRAPAFTNEERTLLSMNVPRLLPQDDAEVQQAYVVVSPDEP